MSKHWKPAITTIEAGLEGLNLSDLSSDSKLVSSKLHIPHDNVKPLITPVYHAATYRINSIDHYLDILKNGGYIYSRLGNPSCEDAESAINVMEGGAGSLVFPSGMAAISTTIACYLRPGDHIICCNPVYSGTHSYLKKYATQWNIEVTFVPTGASVDVYEKASKPNTKMLFGETPCNPLISVLDLEAFGALGKKLNVLTMVDSTYASPYLQQPIRFGIDFVAHSATKYLGGHSDICAGVVTTRTLQQWKDIKGYQSTIGSVMSPHDAYSLSRGLKTLHLRMAKHCSNAQRCAEYLEKHPKVEKVYYPGLPSHPEHELAKSQMKGFSGMLAFEMKGGLEAAKKLVQSVKLIQFAVSLGGVESLIEHPASMTHGPMIMSDEERKEAWICDGLIRLSVGVEDPEDLVKDLSQALDQV